MFRPAAALAACLVALAVTPSAHADTPLTLDDAFARVMATHPALRVHDARRDVLSARVDQASLRPAWRLDAELENAFGSGTLRSLQGAEWTLSLASVLERGGKLDARRTLAESRLDALAVGREKQRLDLLAEAARRYLEVAAARARAGIARGDIERRRHAVEAARKRHRAGAAPESAWLGAQAALSMAEMDLARAEKEGQAARRYLAAMWGGRTTDYDIAAVEVRRLPLLADFSVLAGWLEHTPELAAFADRRRIGEARLQLARSEASADIEWRVGVRRLEADGAMGLVAGVSIPLGSARRAAPEQRAARAELAELAVEREAEEAALYATLAEAHGRYQGARMEVRRLEKEVLPRLARAARAAGKAWRAGAATYIEWAALLSTDTEARRRQLAAAVTAHRALIEIQRLTGQPFVAGGSASRPSVEVAP